MPFGLGRPVRSTLTLLILVPRAPLPCESSPPTYTSPRPYAPSPALSTLQFTTWPVVTFWRSFMVFRGWGVVQVSLFTQVLAHVDLVLAQFGEGVAAHVHGRTGGVLDVSVVHADELAVAGGAYENFDGEGAAAYGLCVSEGSVLGADVAGTAGGR